MSENKGDYNRLLFIGGVTDTQKTAIVESLTAQCKEREKLPDDNYEIYPYRISEYLTSELKDKFKKKEHIYQRDNLPLYEWKVCELAAVQALIHDINIKIKSKISVINCHYAASSPAGFLIGLGVESLLHLSHSVLADSPEDGYALVAIVHIDSNLENILRQKREKKRYSEILTCPDHIITDLELNRLYSLQYYHIFSNLIGYKKTVHLSVFHSEKPYYTARGILDELDSRHFFE